VAERLRQPPVLGELLAGLVLGNLLPLCFGLVRQAAARTGHPEIMLVLGLSLCFVARIRLRVGRIG
jgi:Kef-type K+ transport system membrane component KefB